MLTGLHAVSFDYPTFLLRLADIDSLAPSYFALHHLLSGYHVVSILCEWLVPNPTAFLFVAGIIAVRPTRWGNNDNFFGSYSYISSGTCKSPHEKLARSLRPHNAQRNTACCGEGSTGTANTVLDSSSARIADQVKQIDIGMNEGSSMPSGKDNCSNYTNDCSTGSQKCDTGMGKRRLHFAGEACSSEYFSTAHGAYLSGIAAAQTICEQEFGQSTQERY